MPEKEMTPGGHGSAAAGAEKQKPVPAKPTKLSRVLKAFSEGRTLNRFEAARELSDWCLHSTVSDLEKRGISVAREFETVPGYQGAPTRCCRYWLTPDQQKKARELLGGQ